MVIDRFGFNNDIVKALQDIDSIPTTEPNAVPGIPGSLYIVAPEQKGQLEHIIKILNNIPQDEYTQMNEEEKWFYSTLQNNADRVLRNSISKS